MLAPLATPPRPRARACPSASAGVVVVGGGLAGLATAYELQQAGVTCLVLEARPHMAPRPTGPDGVFDDAAHPRVLELARGLGLRAERQPAAGRDAVQGLADSQADGTPGLEGLHLGSFTRVRDNLDELCRRVDVNRPAQMLPNYGVMSVHELVVSHGATPPVQALAAAWTRAIFGLSSRDVGALPFLLHCKCAGGLSQAISDAGARGPWRLSGGTAQLMAELASRLLPGTLWLSHEVEAVDQTSGSVCVVTTALGAVVRCSNVVVACSASHCRDIAFAPELSEDKQWLHGADPGFVSAVRLVYDEPWWRERGLSGRGIGLDGPVALVTDTSRDSAEEGYSLTCLVAGEPGRELYRLPESDRHARVVRHAEAILGGSSPTPCGVAELGQGAGCLAVPARGLGSLERDQWRPEGAVFFAGADTSLASRGHMEGALAASARATDHILRAARPSTELAARL